MASVWLGHISPAVREVGRREFTESIRVYRIAIPGRLGFFSAYDELLSFPTGFLSVRNARSQRETGHGKRVRTCDGRETVESRRGDGGERRMS